ncbi:restriction endonuclease subunit S [Bacillus tropicus]|uniref:restriction endonuclease subunit S n=1 Tax=Bacillus TaxID=1386 RepID=UPI002166F66F|nr:restriction endonuclease subunit S [Bacillus sp. JUb91]MCS3599045.1 type I restriction enzyme S subunit [Bacillus sp. JUb91]
MKNKRTPDIRFPEFTKIWDERKLKDVANFIRGSFPQPYTNPDWYDAENGRPFVQVADIGFDLKLNKDTKLHISKVAEPKSRFVEAGKVVVALQGSIEKSIGRVAITQYDAFFDRTILIFESYKTEIDNHYFAQVIQKLFQREKEKAWGATISTITKEALSDFVIGVPNIEEQTKIGNFLKQLDDTIALHQQELTTLKQAKKGFLQKMFPKEGEFVPEIRFPGFTGDWKQCKLNEVAEIIGGGTPKTDVQEYWDGDIDWYSPMEIGNEIYAFGSQRKITALGLKKSSAKILPANKTILFTSRAGIGDMAILKNDGATNQGFQSLVVNNNYDIYFVYSIGYKIKEFALKHAAGSTFLEISGKGLGEMNLFVPSLEEQTKIGNFFKQLDDTIALHQRELDAFNETKKAFLQKMFA